MAEKSWFASWFDSKYYHILYQSRDEKEAHMIIDHLLTVIKPRKNSRMLDLACGKGRHAKYLAEQGFEVTGVDLSEKSIKAARKYEQELLSFYSHDMRNPFRTNYYNYIFNFFTSFGYFDSDKDHLDALKNVTKGLRKNGVFVMDFFNANKVIAHLKPRQQKTIKGIQFKITRKVVDGYIIKTIKFTDKGKDYVFQEKVRAFDKKTLKKYFKKAGLEVTDIFGSYTLEKYKPSTSDRLIIFAKKQ